ncbi:MAG: non-canonical purine NTP pyrophosphatase, RdgB/HAM1 family [Gammaproteobacteria bacterium]|nr:non-canonical purine NTP pyrophosphatase, RdgB/HAM1 family [Gammaproteobacteria bacterium]
MKLIFASKNSGKTRELSRALEGTEFSVESLIGQKIEAAPETGSSFLENALIKCKSVAEITGMPTVADDSGLVVPALNGRPGIYSARYSGSGATDEENIQKLTREMMPISDRRAYFFCCIVFMVSPDDPFPIFAQGLWKGEILNTPAGSSGFGYDPIFYLPDYGKTAAELPLELKTSISHRALAIKDFLSIYLKHEENLC